MGERTEPSATYGRFHLASFFAHSQMAWEHFHQVSLTRSASLLGPACISCLPYLLQDFRGSLKQLWLHCGVPFRFDHRRCHQYNCYHLNRTLCWLFCSHCPCLLNISRYAIQSYRYTYHKFMFQLILWLLTVTNQIKVVAFNVPQLTQASFFKKIKRCKMFFLYLQCWDGTEPQ